MSEQQGPRVPGEEGPGRRRPVGWIIGGVVALGLLAVLVPFACQAIRGEPEEQGGDLGTPEDTVAQGGAGGEAEPTGVGESIRTETAGDGSPGEQAVAQPKGAARGGGGEADKPLPASGGTPIAVLLVAGAILVVAAASLSASAYRRGAGRG